MKQEMEPVGYSIVYMSEYGAANKQSITVIAVDAIEALSVAETYGKLSGKLDAVSPWRPRWVASDTDIPHVLSEAVLRRYAHKLGFELVRPISADQP